MPPRPIGVISDSWVASSSTIRRRLRPRVCPSYDFRFHGCNGVMVCVTRMARLFRSQAWPRGTQKGTRLRRFHAQSDWGLVEQYPNAVAYHSSRSACGIAYSRVYRFRKNREPARSRLPPQAEVLASDR